MKDLHHFVLKTFVKYQVDVVFISRFAWGQAKFKCGGFDNAQIVHIFSRVICVYLVIFICFCYLIVLKYVCKAFVAKSRKMEETWRNWRICHFQVKIYVIQAFHKEESKFSSFQSSLTRNNQVWTKNEESKERSRAWISAAFQPIGNSSNRSVRLKTKKTKN